MLHRGSAGGTRWGRLRLVADARIDNRPELLEQLDEVLTRVPSVTDAHLILGAWTKWGQECPVHLVGDFAFVLWSESDQLLLAACDPMNMRTLYYAQLGEVHWLATEAGQLLRHPDVRVELDEVFLARRLIGWPDHNGSVYRGIERLPAGHTLIARDGSPILVRRFWDIDPARTIRYRRLHDYADHFRELLSRCVSDRLRTDGSVASEMSGGLDSTTVTALATWHLRSRNTEPLVISHRYPDIASLDETTLIGAMAEHLKVEPHFIDVESSWSPLTDYVPLAESPGSLVSPLLYREMELVARAGAKVVLSGIGGDEMTWGHPLIFAHRISRGDLAVVQQLLSYCRATELPPLRHLYSTLLRPLLPGRILEPLRRILGRPDAQPWWPGWFPGATAERLGIGAHRFAASE